MLTPSAELGYTPVMPDGCPYADYKICHIERCAETSCLPRCMVHEMSGDLDETDGSLYIPLEAPHRLPFPRITRKELTTFDAEVEYARVIRSRCDSWKASGDPISAMQKPSDKFHELLPGLWAQVLKEAGLLR